MDSSNGQSKMLCDVCGEAFEEGEAMRRVPAIGFMHVACKAPAPFSWEPLVKDSSNAEKAISLEELRMSPAERIMFTAGRASRDAEVAELTRLLAESRAANGDSEARRAELEAVIEKVRGIHRAKHGEGERGPYIICDYDKTPWPCLTDGILSTDPSVVLEDRDRENRAIGWDEGWVNRASRSPFGWVSVPEPPRTLNPYRGDNR